MTQKDRRFMLHAQFSLSRTSHGNVISDTMEGSDGVERARWHACPTR
ncbi:hypothetical protein [Bifidobacterium tibiigranuli]|nr:hypothetical protein [Bifidobacterium tibiigranuli]MCI1712605.1 hypothetical protein [Bifidobacterium tibiigranuli]MCI1833778.1 hypothetical protein [Bifidobacterium tibiigranuli]